ncbi:tumor necrosis factor ligand superfamily member 14-like isoform X2 [Sphaeramia orbicularis]|uniref:tumor necrosis factor ligand superfamily member 14-like isoform X2 n=1 Tax=Sphaeramia orbicularis TaxID=375764 RepID=UPI00117CEE2C|nr:tumor necrosis factor ligand superfamily member 14-like isoform X2 [Sphaeramia orbicularis]
MVEGGVGTSPHVFVVDSQASYASLPSKKKPWWNRVRQRFLLPLLGLVLFGLAVEGFFLYKLYQKTEMFFCLPPSLCHNQSNPQISAQLGGPVPSPGRTEGSVEFHTTQPLPDQLKRRPMAHLLGPRGSVGPDNVVLWQKQGEAFTLDMGYNNGRLVTEKEGYYYLYSKVHLNAAKECLVISHKVLKNTNAYGKPIELMKSKSFRCPTQEPPSQRSSNAENLWNSFLAGIFHLEKGDQIYVTLDNGQSLRPGPTDSFMGAFMISP